MSRCVILYRRIMEIQHVYILKSNEFDCLHCPLTCTGKCPTLLVFSTRLGPSHVTRVWVCVETITLAFWRFRRTTTVLVLYQNSPHPLTPLARDFLT